MKKMLLAAVALATISSGANATTIKFTGLNAYYGDGSPLGPNMTSTASSLSYTESGYSLTLNTPNTYDYGSHVGDGTSAADTFNFHDDGDNGPNSYLTLTRVGGGLFSLNSFDYSFTAYFGSSDATATITAGTNTPLLLTGTGTSTSGFSNVSSVTFSNPGVYNYIQLDNVNVTAGAGAVPEPATWAMMLVGFGGVGYAMRSRRKVAVSFG